MSDIKSFIDQAAGTLGVSSQDTGSAVSGLLGLIQDKADAKDSGDLLKALPGASDLMKGGQGGGLMGGVMGVAGGLFGGKAGSALSVLSIFKNANMDTNQAGAFMGLFIDYVSKNAGGDLFGRILEQIPDLKKLVGNAV